MCTRKLQGLKIDSVEGITFAIGQALGAVAGIELDTVNDNKTKMYVKMFSIFFSILLVKFKRTFISQTTRSIRSVFGNQRCESDYKCSVKIGCRKVYNHFRVK